MKCPHCQKNDLHGVYKTFQLLNMICRERVCDSCGRKFHTKEEVYNKITKDSEQQEPIDFGASGKEKPKG